MHLYSHFYLGKLKDLDFRAVWKLFNFIVFHISFVLSVDPLEILYSTHAKFAIKVKISVVIRKYMLCF